MRSFKKRRYEIALGILIVLYIAYFSYYTLLRHQTFNSSYYDLGIMDQTVYNTYKGRILELTNPFGSSTVKRMAFHNDVLLALLAPFYAIYNDPGTLLVIQTVILALGAIPVYLISKDVLRSKPLALVFSFAYLMYPPLQRANIFDFHAVTLATFFLLYMYYFSFHRRYFLFSIFFYILSILTKEQVALTTTIFGIFLIWQGGKNSQKEEAETNKVSTITDEFGMSYKEPNAKRTKRTRHLATQQIAQSRRNWKGYSSTTPKLGWFILSLSIVWFILSIWLIIPYFRGGPHFATARYSEFGESPEQIIAGVIFQPQTVFKKLFDFTTLLYFIWIFSPIAFASFLSPAHLLIATPEFAINLLSDNYNMRNVIHHYTAVITPFVFISAIYGVKLVMDRSRWFTAKKIVSLLFLATMYTSITMSPLPYSLKADNRPFQALRPETDHVSLWQKRLSDENIKVSATGTLAPHFSHRKTILRFPNYQSADYVVLFTDQVLNDWLEYEQSRNAYKTLKQDQNYRLIYQAGMLEVYRKR